jgi:cytochrome c oxidase subunit 4
MTMVDHTHSSHHITSRKTYFLVFLALMILTVVTWLVAQVDLGWANDLVALTVAFTKAMLVILFFMHVRHSTRMTILTASAGFFWLAIMLFYTLSDYFTRGASVLPVMGK